MLYRSTVLLSLLLTAATVASAQKDVKTTISPEFDFGAVETYHWKSRSERSELPLKDGGPLDQALRRGADQVLRKAGLQRVEGDGDMALTYEAVVVDTYVAPDKFEAVDMTAPGAIGAPMGQAYKEAALLITAHDPDDDELVWSGIGRKNLGSNPFITDSPPLRKKAEALAKKVAKALASARKR